MQYSVAKLLSKGQVPLTLGRLLRSCMSLVAMSFQVDTCLRTDLMPDPQPWLPMSALSPSMAVGCFQLESEPKYRRTMAQLASWIVGHCRKLFVSARSTTWCVCRWQWRQVLVGIAWCRRSVWTWNRCRRNRSRWNRWQRCVRRYVSRRLRGRDSVPC